MAEEQRNPAETQTPTTIEFLEKFTQAFKDAKVEQWFDIEKADAYIQEHKRERKTAPVLEMNQFCEAFGVSKQDMHKIVDYLQCPQGSEDATKKLNGLLRNLANHMPKEGELSREAFDEWKQITKKAGEGLADLNKAWKELEKQKSDYETQKENLLKAIDSQKEGIRRLNSIIYDAEQARKRLEQDIEAQEAIKKSATATQAEKDAAEVKLETLRLQKSMAEALVINNKPVLESQERGVKTLEDKVRSIDKDLERTEASLRAKSFEINAVTLISAFPDKADTVLSKAAILTEKTREAQETAEEVYELADKYKDRHLEYGKHASWLIQRAEAMQQTESRLLRALGNFIIDKEIDRVQAHYEKEVNQDIKELKKAIDQEMGRGKGLLATLQRWDEKTTDWVIQSDIKDAQRALQKVNKYEKQIMDAKAHAEQQVIINLKRADPSLANKTNDAIKNTPEFKKAYAKMESIHVGDLEKKRDAQLEKFKDYYRNSQRLIRAREERQQSLMHELKALGHTVENLRGTNDISQGFKFAEQEGFEADLKTLLAHNSQQTQAFAPRNGMEQSTAQLATQAMHDIDQEFDRGR